MVEGSGLGPQHPSPPPPPRTPGGDRCNSLLCTGVNEQRLGSQCGKGARLCKCPFMVLVKGFPKSACRSLLVNYNVNYNVNYMLTSNCSSGSSCWSSPLGENCHPVT